MIIDINSKMEYKNNMYNPYKGLQLYSDGGSNYGPRSIKAIFTPTTARSLKTIIGEINNVIDIISRNI